MSEQSVGTVKKRHFAAAGALLVLLGFPLILLLFFRMGSRRYYLCSMLIILLSVLLFFLHFESRKPQAREIVTLAVMSAIAVASRSAFIMLPHIKPMVGIVMITGMAMGAESGFLCGAISGFVSNFLFGQGPWTPWQMFAYGIAGWIAGLLGRKGIMGGGKKLLTSVIGAALVLCLVGPLLDTSTLLTVGGHITSASAGAVYLAGLPVNLIHAAATFLTLLLLTRPVCEKLDRLRIKYGMMDG